MHGGAQWLRQLISHALVVRRRARRAWRSPRETAAVGAGPRGRGRGGPPPGIGSGRGGPGGAPPHSHQHQHQQQANGAPRGPPPPRPPLVPPVPVPTEDFDFEAALAKFEKADINKVRKWLSVVCHSVFLRIHGPQKQAVVSDCLRPPRPLAVGSMYMQKEAPTVGISRHGQCIYRVAHCGQSM